MKKENLNEENLNEKETKKNYDFLKKKEIWISGIIGMLLGAVILYLVILFVMPSKLYKGIIAKTNIKEITTTDLYDNLYKGIKRNTLLQSALETIDAVILEEKYQLTEEQNKELNDEIENILSQELAFLNSEEEFYSNYGFKDKNDFVNFMTLQYKFNLAFVDYYESLIKEEEIQNYFNENEVYGEIKTKHILVKLSDDGDETKALAKANEIVNKLKEGRNFDDLMVEYTDDITTISENVNFSWINADELAQEYVTASKALEKDQYTTSPVETMFGYHIIYCIDKETEKPTLEKDKETIRKKLGENLRMQFESTDQYISDKILIKLREDYGLEFKDKKFKEEYQKYCDIINNSEEVIM